MYCLLTRSLTELLLADNEKASGKREKFQAVFYLVSTVNHRRIVSRIVCVQPDESELIAIILRPAYPARLNNLTQPFFLLVKAF